MAAEDMTTSPSMTTTESSFPEHLLDRDSLYSYPFIDLMIILYTALCVAGICANLVVVSVFALNKVMRSVTNILILNLAIADLARLFVSVPYLVQILYVSYPFSEGACKFLNFAVPTTYFVSVYTLLFISISRFLTIVKPAVLMRLRTRFWTAIFCAAIWLFMFCIHIEILATTRLISIGSSYDASEKLKFCVFVPTWKAQPWLEFLLGYWVPVSPIFYLSVLTLRHLYKQQTRQYLESRNQLYKISIMIFCITVALAVLLLPYFVFNIVIQYILIGGNYSPDSLTTLHGIWITFFTLYTANSCINPFLYNYFSKDFHLAFLGLVPFRARRSRVPQQQSESESLNNDGDVQGDTSNQVLMQTY